MRPKHSILTLAILAFCVATFVSSVRAQTDIHRTRTYIDTVYSTSMKLLIPKLARRAADVTIYHRGKVGGGTGTLYAGLISTEAGSHDTTSTLVAGWMGCSPLDSAGTLTFLNCVADSLYLKSSDSVKVEIHFR